MKCIGFFKTIGIQIVFAIIFIIMYLISGGNSAISFTGKAINFSVGLWWIASFIAYYIMSIPCEYF